MTSMWIWNFSYLGLLFTCHVQCTTLTYTRALYTDLMANYTKYLRPTNDQSQPTKVEIRFFLKSITSLNEVDGIMTTVVNLNLRWTDETLKWNPVNYGNINNIKFDNSLIWTPVFVTTNSAKKITQIGLQNVPLSVEYNGEVSSDLGDMLSTTCDIDVTHFPFDTQKCVIELVPWGYRTDINMSLKEDNLDAIYTTVYSENNLWVLLSTNSEESLLGDMPYAKLTFTLERRYAFFILNLFSPVLLIAVLNSMVFILPAESGERVGFAITCLLALSVYMTFASSSLPVSSKPIAALTYILLCYMIISAVMCLEVILSLKLHLHDDAGNPPKYLIKMFCIGRKVCRKQENIIHSDTDTVDEKKEPREEKETTWKQLGQRFDLICFSSNLFCMFLLSFIYFLVVSS